MKARTLRIHLAAILLLFTLSASAQEAHTELDSVLTYMKLAKRFCLWRPQEKVYLHMDNTGYFKGETIWLKAYVVRTDNGTPTDLSKILYVELLSPSGDVVATRKLPIKQGVAYGDIKVDSIITTGFYEIRAFTRYMTNWGTNACFSRILPIFKEPKAEGIWVNPVIDKQRYNKRLNNERIASIDAENKNIISVIDESESNHAKKDKEQRVHFYPEGGDLVESLPARVAFTLTGSDGMPLSESCTVVDKQGNTIARCSTDANGFGSFTLPNATSGLYLVDGKSKKQALPTPKDTGCSMMIDMLDDEKVTVSFHTTPSLHNKLLGYVMINNGNIVRCDTMTAAAATQRQFRRAYLPAGVNQLTLYDSNGRILAERMFFICPRPDNTKNIDITSQTTHLRPCSKLKFRITAEPHANLSFSAIDADGLVNGSYGNMHTWMLLSSELRGYIAHPEYYFEADDLEHRKAADLLMLVQGWKRYDWNLMTGQSTFIKYQPIEDKPYLFGRLHQKTKRGTVEDVWIEAKLYNHEGHSLKGQTKTDSLGYYTFEMPNIDGEWQMHINTGKAGRDGFWEDMDYYVAIDRNFSPEPRYISPLETVATPIDTTGLFRWEFSEKDELWVGQLNRSRVLKNVTVTAKKRFWDRTNWSNETNPRQNSLIYYNCDEYSEKIADEGKIMPSLYEWLTQVNSFFAGDITPDDGYTLSVDTNLIGTAGTRYYLSANGEIMDDMGFPLIYYRGGLGYNNRPIVWILDNKFYGVTNLPTMNYIEVLWSDASNNRVDLIPESLDEAKSVYISEDIHLMHNHIMCEQIETRQPVIVYVYSHRKFMYNQKGLRRTRYHGYNVPSTFEMEDYSKIPPIEDFRRTLYWQPEVKTDDKGKATVEFWNNSSATDIKVSCEGMTKDGKVLVF